MLEKYDEKFSILAEASARKISRRGVVTRLVKGAVATVAALTIGQLAGKEAFAETCPCSPPGSGYCSGCPSGGGCPSGYSVCVRDGSCNGSCPWTGGAWSSICNGVCGYVICTDCRQNGQSGCNGLCGCKSAVIPNCR